MLRDREFTWLGEVANWVEACDACGDHENISLITSNEKAQILERGELSPGLGNFLPVLSPYCRTGKMDG